MPEDKEGVCGNERTFQLAPHTEVTVKCGLAKDHLGGVVSHHARDVVDGVIITYRWEVEPDV